MEHLTTGSTTWIAGAPTVVVIFTAGVLVGVLVYHCIIKHQSKSSKPDTSLFNEQPQAVPVSSSDPLRQTDPEYEEAIKLKQNKAYEETQIEIEMKANESYQ